MTEYSIALPVPHARQIAFETSIAKRKVIVAGRRGGKTTGVSRLAALAALAGRRVLEAAPTDDQTGAFWDAIKKYFAEPIAAGIVYKNETKRMVELPNGGRIRCKTAWNADTLRGDYADLLILDEYSIMAADAWEEVGAPMLLDNDGDAVFIFTPKRRNHAHRLYLQAATDDTGRWEAFHFTSYDNPHLSADALAEITADMTDEAYRQEIMAEFLESDGVVFRNVAACMTAPGIADINQHEGHRFVAGVDWGKQQDYTVISVGCATCHQEVERARSNKIDYHYQVALLADLWRRWNCTILAESNSMGGPIIEMLHREGLPVVPFETTAQSKGPLIENLALAFQLSEWRFQPDTLWQAEIEAYERKVSAATGRSQYGAPDGMHDDTVISRALMVWAARHTPAIEAQPVERSKWELETADDGGRWKRY